MCSTRASTTSTPTSRRTSTPPRTARACRGDLVIDLIAPDGTAYRLKASSNDGADNVVTTYTVNASSEVANGTWKLQVKDLAAQDSGYINSWKLTFWSGIRRNLGGGG